VSDATERHQQAVRDLRALEAQWNTMTLTDRARVALERRIRAQRAEVTRRFLDLPEA
jgi:hypothetical protein